ncbi:MAG: 5-formyltetrahydrofolate cyclo-ligase [Candidatus Scatovivens sp.]
MVNGFYDKFISKNRKNFYLGICFENQIIEDFEYDQFDEKVDCIITEENIIV